MTTIICTARFLSTLSLRRATGRGIRRYLAARFLSTLSLRRATASNQRERQEQRISIHALLAESDAVQIIVVIAYALFLSTLSLRRATFMDRKGRAVILHFYPRSPCGERQYHRILLQRNAGYFYPRSPCGERHNINSSVNTADQISIHALLAESDAFRQFQPALR